MTNWKDIHPDFTPELQKEWEDRGFSYEECKEWINIGLRAIDHEFVWWLKNIIKISQQVVEKNSQVLRKQFEKYLEDQQNDSDKELETRTKRALSITAKPHEKNKIFKQGEKNETRNALIVGLTGSGKSALANTLTNTNRFLEGNSCISITRDFQVSDIFEWKGERYRVIDNIGFGDTANFSEEDILRRIGEGIYSAQEGINQVFFVFRGKFSPEQSRAFNLLKKLISESRITEFTTIIRTHFSNFRKSERCREDRENLIRENQELSDIINSCKYIIHVDNPPIPEIKEGDDEKTKERKKKRARMYEEDKKDSREKILNYLVENCPEIYRLEEWDNIYSVVADYMKKKEVIEKSCSLAKEEEIREELSEVTRKIKFLLETELPIFSELTAVIEKNTQKY